MNGAVSSSSSGKLEVGNAYQLLSLVDLVFGTARNFAAGQEVALAVPPNAIRLYS